MLAKVNNLFNSEYQFNDCLLGQPAYQAHYTPVGMASTFEAADLAGAAKAFKPSVFRRSRRILTAANLSDAVRGCDTYAKEKVMRGPMIQGSVYPFLHPTGRKLIRVT